MSQFSWKTASSYAYSGASQSSHSYTVSSAMRSSKHNYSAEDFVDNTYELAATETLRYYKYAFTASDDPIVTTTDNLQAEPLVYKLIQRDKEIQDLRTQVDYLTTYLEAAGLQENPASVAATRYQTYLKIELQRTQGYLAVAQDRGDFYYSEVTRLKTLLLLREKYLSILYQPRSRKQPTKVDLDEKVYILLEQNRKIMYYLVDNRSKLTKEYFVALLSERLKEAVLIYTESLTHRNYELEEEVDALQEKCSRQAYVINIFERESVKTLEAADNYFRRYLGELKTEVALLNRYLYQKEDVIKYLKVQARHFDTQTLIMKEISGQKDAAYERKAVENQTLKYEMTARNIYCRGILRDAQRQISDKLVDMKRENIRIAEQFYNLQREVNADVNTEKRLNEIYGELDYIREYCKGRYSESI